jgi:hypothetical protein
VNEKPLPLVYDIAAGRDFDQVVADLTKDARVEVDSRGKDGQCTTSLAAAACYGYTVVVSALLTHWPMHDQCECHGNGSLSVAIWNINVDAVKLTAIRCQRALPANQRGIKEIEEFVIPISN